MKQILCFLFTLVSVSAFGCRCGFPKLMENYERSDFVAVVKIIKVTPDLKNETYLTLEIEPIEVYKGKEYAFMRVNTFANTSCAFSLPLGSTWLVFTQVEDNGVPGFGPCSGSQQIHRNVNAVNKPTTAEVYGKAVDLKLAVLSFLKNNGLENFNPYGLNLFDLKIQNSIMFKGFENQNKFAVYELDVNEDLSIKKITALQEFENPKLAQLFVRYLQKNARVSNITRTGTPTSSKLILVYYYYPSESKGLGFVSQFDL
jgi:hypothetical protein